MTTRFLHALLTISLFWQVAPGKAADQVTLQFKPAGAQGVIDLHSTLALPVSATYPEYTVLYSTNLQTWEPLPGVVAGGVGVSDELLRLAVPLAGQQAWYKVVANVKPAPDGSVGEAVYGYSTAFHRELQRLGQLPLSDFVARYNLTNTFLPQLSFDPTSAEYWTNFNAAPVPPRVHDFRFNAQELAVFMTNGFVVSQRLGSDSFADQFYRIFNDDLPVFFSTDAALHAWHKSYDGMLEELEEVQLSRLLQGILNGMGGKVSTLASDAAGTALVDGVRDADMFVAVGRSLVSGTNDYGSLGQNSRIQTVLDAIAAQQPAKINLFGADRVMDFSQFQPRGHYTTSLKLQRYFRALMWCSLADFRFTGSTNDNSLRELSGAVSMGLLLKNWGFLSNAQQLESLIRMFVGVPDSLNLCGLSDLLTAAGITSPANLPNTATLQALQAKLMCGQLGVQNIRSDYFYSPLTRQQIKLPRSFTMMGQCFVLDGWALSSCSFDSIIWDSDGIPNFQDKVMRRVPSALDVAFSVLGNNHTVPDLAARIANSNGRTFRDGLPYQHNLAAVRNVVDSQDASAWTNSLYGHWLACLRELSQPTIGPEYPETMRTRAWAMKTLNTQLASWTELKHDTVLYAKQPYTGVILCLYPAGYVEPRTNFWARMRDMALCASNLLSTLTRSGQITLEPSGTDASAFTVSYGDIYTNRLQFLSNFASNMTVLQGISEKELRHQALNTTETVYLQNLIEFVDTYGGDRTYSGWYPSLFYHNVRTQHSTDEPSDQADQLVTDVFTDPMEPLVNDPGCVLHEGVGNVLMLLLAADSGPNSRAVYAGPVMSHYEFEEGPTTRLADYQWQSIVRNGPLPAPPDWTRSFLVPSP